MTDEKTPEPTIEPEGMPNPATIEEQPEEGGAVEVTDASQIEPEKELPAAPDGTQTQNGEPL